MTRPKIYLAGPGVFLITAVEHGEKLKAICAEFNCEGLYPIDNKIDLNAKDAALQIMNENCRMIMAAQAIVADITPFRGPHMDVGTAFEIGYASAMHKEAFYYSGDRRTLIERFPLPNKYRHDSGAWRDYTGMLIEDFGLAENLMITPHNPVADPNGTILNEAGIAAFHVHADPRDAIKEAAISLGAIDG